MSVCASPNEPRAASTIVIRTMRLEDLPRVYALGEELFTAQKWPALYRAWDEYEIIEYFATDGEFCLVAVMESDEEDSEDGDDGEPEEELVGFCLGTLLEKRRSAWRYGYLVWMGVDPVLKGRGIGRRLLAHLTDLFVENGARMMLVDTAANNESALRFFRSQGFGHDLEHVYLSRNLDKHPKAIKRRKANTERTRQDRPRKGRAQAGPMGTEIVTPAVTDPGAAAGDGSGVLKQ